MSIILQLHCFCVSVNFLHHPTKKVIEPEKMYASKWSKCVEQWSDLVLPGREGNSMVWIGKA